MQPNNTFRYILLMITVTTSCASAETHGENKEVKETNKIIRVNKRDATMLVDNFPMETVYHKPKVIYRRVSRISKHKYGPSKPKYGPPRPKYGPSKLTRKPGKKYRGKNASPKYRPQNYKKYTTKPKFGSPKRSKPMYGLPNRTPHYPIYPPVSSGFAEPPLKLNDYAKLNHGEPPVDSYGAIVTTTLKDLYPTIQAFKSIQHFDNDEFAQLGQEYHSWKNTKRGQNVDSINDYSKKHPVYMKPDPDVFVTPLTQTGGEENLHSYSDIYKKEDKQKQKKQKEKRKKPLYSENMKFANRPRKQQKLDEEIIVGGQYAEPPARYIHKIKSDSPMFDDDEFLPPHHFIDSEIPLSATNSPYVNYKNSNVAFSPQNLNDAFSIVD